jgi:hypothetical protein
MAPIVCDFFSKDKVKNSDAHVPFQKSSKAEAKKKLIAYFNDNETMSNVKIVIKKDEEDLKGVDAILISIDESFELKNTFSKLIVEKGGDQVFKALRDSIRENLEIECELNGDCLNLLGQVFKISSGNLNVHLFYTIVPNKGQLCPFSEIVCNYLVECNRENIEKVSLSLSLLNDLKDLNLRDQIYDQIFCGLKLFSQMGLFMVKYFFLA